MRHVNIKITRSNFLCLKANQKNIYMIEPCPVSVMDQATGKTAL